MEVLFVELTAVGRFHRGTWFPLLKGYLRDCGVPVRWIRFGLQAAARAASGEDGIALGPAELKRLAAVVRECAATHVLVSPSPAPSLVAAVRAQNPEVCIGVGIPTRREDIDAFLGRSGDRDSSALYEAVTPDFGWEAGNDAAADAPSLPFLLCGPECTYRRPLAHNPFFAGLDLSGCGRITGCTFCVRADEPPGARQDAVEVFSRQLHALSATHPRWQGRLAVRAVGEPVLLHIERIAEELASASVAPLELLLDGRPDVIVARQDTLRRALERLLPGPHMLHLALVGIESFAERDLLLFNKGTHWQQSLDAARVLLELERDFPSAFAFRQHGGLSLLLQHPWTRLEDLALNLALIRRCDLADLCGKLFTSRLRLYPRLPLYPMAIRDGLTLERYDDPRLDTARHNFYEDEVPWRFADPRLESLGRVLLRLAADPSDSDDIERALRPLRNASAEGMVPWAEALIDSCLASEHPLPWRELMALTLARAAAPRRSVPGRPLAIRAFEAGLKPVVRLELEDLAANGWSEEAIAAMAPVVVRRERPGIPGSRAEVFLGRDAAQVREAVELTDRAEGGAAHAEWQIAAERTGVLLGYPPCCARAFSLRGSSIRDSYVWTHVQSRLDSPGEVPWLLNPGPEETVNFVPCSLHCNEARSWAAAMFERTRTDDLERVLKRPWILLVDRQGDTAELVTDHEPRGRIPYRAGAVRGTHPLLTEIAAGDELEVGEQHLLVLRNGRVTASLGGRAFVWWYREAIQPELWGRVCALRFGERLAAAGQTASREAAGAAAQRSAELLSRVLGISAGRPIACNGYRVTSIHAGRESQVRVLLRAAHDELEVLLWLAPPGTPCHARVGSLAMSVPNDLRIDTPARALALKVLVHHLTAVFARNRTQKPGRHA